MTASDVWTIMIVRDLESRGLIIRFTDCRLMTTAETDYDGHTYIGTGDSRGAALATLLCGALWETGIFTE
jgi:hypothetical protein